MNAFQLKIIAIITMLIDHIGYIYINHSDPEYLLFRGIGRFAFPIFIWFIAEGCSKTKNIEQYISRLLAFAFISEIFFDYAFSHVYIEFTHQNIFFTLFLGAFSIYISSKIELKVSQFKNLVILVPNILALVAELLNTDYGAIGVLMIYFLYVYREQNFIYKAGILLLGNMMLLLGSHPIQILAITTVVPLYFYNGERGKPLKYFFYFFYPIHLFILGLINNLIL